MNIGFEDLIRKIKSYNPEEVEIITKAYNVAKDLHEGQFRESGEPYIIHPLNVAYILADMKADRDTVCAGLLHDTIEDTKMTKEELAELFNPDVANLVDGVTKLAKMDFVSKESLKLANQRKLITGITSDVRIIIIKLADRLHNMRTLQYKRVEKQRETAAETLEIYTPFADFIGAYSLKTELEDLSLKYIKPDSYRRIEYEKNRIEEQSSACLYEMFQSIRKVLDNKEIPNEIKIRIMNIYGIYKNIKDNKKIEEEVENIRDLLALKVIVDDIDNCYRSLGVVHSLYNQKTTSFKDYIYNPKSNLYQSLHTTVVAPDNKIVLTQIRTFDMDKIADYGLTAYWNINKGEARYRMQNDLRKKSTYQSLVEISEVFDDNKEFLDSVKTEVISDRVFVYNKDGKKVELPKGSTAIDFAYAEDDTKANMIIGAEINNKVKKPESVLYNNDRVVMITSEDSDGPKEEWLSVVKTIHAKRKIKEFHKLNR